MRLFPLQAATLAAIGVVAISAAKVVPAKADVQFEERGPVGYLISRHLRPGDAEAFQEFLDRPRAQPLRIIYMDSRGGNPETGMEIGRLIRQHGLDTGFHAGRGRCVSACTAMFLGGVHRYYLGGNGIHDGPGTRMGLGFHPPKNPDPEGEDIMNGYYREMGAPGATSLRYRIYPRDRLDEPFEGTGPRGVREMFFAGSRTAIRDGVATSTSVPPGLRD